MIFRATAIASVLAGLLIGCAPENKPQPDSTQAANKKSQNKEAPLDPGADDTTWASQLIVKSSQWTPVTPEPISADRQIYRLCDAIPLSLKPKNGPHGREVFNPEQTPANQFIVSGEARPYFYEDPDDQGRFAIDGAFPVGSTIVKEKYDDIDDANKRKQARAIAVMTKRKPGYDPEHGDWEYA